jgi:glycosyltransferase involved in cell wall biosynthesis
VKILGIGKAGGGLGISAVRAIWPLAALNRRPDFTCKWVKPEDVYRMGTQEEIDQLKGYDVYLQVRANAELDDGYNPMESFLADGAVHVYDIDDDLTGQYRDFGKTRGLEDTVRVCDAVTCTSEALASQMGRYGKPTYVVPNALDVEWYEKSCSKTERDDDVFTIGLIGTETHFFDWLLVKDALVAIKEEFPHVRILCGGYRPAFLEDVADVFYAPVPFMVYPCLLRQIDVRLCPLESVEQEPFNASKSPIAALEAMSAARDVRKGKLGGAVPLCSDHPVYRDTIQQRVNGLLVPDDGWYEAIKLVVAHKKVCQAMAVAGHRWVKAHGSIEQTVDRWAQVYTAIVEGKRNGSKNKAQVQEEVDAVCK